MEGVEGVQRWSRRHVLSSNPIDIPPADDTTLNPATTSSTNSIQSQLPPKTAMMTTSQSLALPHRISSAAPSPPQSRFSTPGSRLKTVLSSTRVCPLFPFPSSVSIPQIPNPLPIARYVHLTNDHLHRKAFRAHPLLHPPQPKPPSPPSSRPQQQLSSNAQNNASQNSQENRIVRGGDWRAKEA
jgi:hypothetical protein